MFGGNLELLAWEETKLNPISEKGTRAALCWPGCSWIYIFLNSKYGGLPFNKILDAFSQPWIFSPRLWHFPNSFSISSFVQSHVIVMSELQGYSKGMKAWMKDSRGKKRKQCIAIWRIAWSLLHVSCLCRLKLDFYRGWFDFRLTKQELEEDLSLISNAKIRPALKIVQLQFQHCRCFLIFYFTLQTKNESDSFTK